MADALISPAVGASMWAATAATAAWCTHRVREEADPARVPLMGVTGAFVFAGQMLNFTIPGTGSSGHIAGGILLAALLGPEAAFLVMASVLSVQALFFADGGLLALGANIFNLGFIPAFVAYPLVFRPLAGSGGSHRRLVAAGVAASAVAVSLGAAGVVTETVLSGVSALPLGAFLALMLPIHLAIGVVEGAVTAVVLHFVSRAQPDAIASQAEDSVRVRALRTGIAAAFVVAALAAIALSPLASVAPDGLEWSLLRLTGSPELEAPETPAHERAGTLQGLTALMPDYAPVEREPRSAGSESLWGAAAVLALIVVAGVALRRRSLGAAGSART